jgi:hypothetical protein
VELVADSNPTGNAQAFQYTATTSGTTSQIFVYLDATSTASQVVVGAVHQHRRQQSWHALGSRDHQLADRWRLELGDHPGDQHRRHKLLNRDSGAVEQHRHDRVS